MVSIIVPVYNSAKYLRSCVHSLLQQTYTKLEVILVDDGSRDDSPIICDQLAIQDKRVKVLHKKNGGISSARNAGLDIAKGNWVTFCDNDDLVSPYWLERMLKLAAADTLPMCAFTRKKENIGMEVNVRSVAAGTKVSVEEYLEYYKQRLGGFVWNALFNREIIQEHNIRFPERKNQGDINEDLIFDFHYLPYIQKIAYTGYSDYYWASNDSNHSKETAQKFYFEKYEEKCHLWHDYIANYIKKDLQKEQRQQLATFHLFELVQSILSSPSYSEMKKRIAHPTIQKCIRMANIPDSDRKIVWLIKHKLTFIIWYLLK